MKGAVANVGDGKGVYGEGGDKFLVIASCGQVDGSADSVWSVDEVKVWGRKFQRATMNLRLRHVVVPLDVDGNIGVVCRLVQDGMLEVPPGVQERCSEAFPVDGIRVNREIGKSVTAEPRTETRTETRSGVRVDTSVETTDANVDGIDFDEGEASFSEGEPDDTRVPFPRAVNPFVKVSGTREPFAGVGLTYGNAHSVMLVGCTGARVADEMRKHMGVKKVREGYRISPAHIYDVVLWCAREGIPVDDEVWNNVTRLGVPAGVRVTERYLDEIPVSRLPSVGTRKSKKFQAMGIHTVRDVLLTLPRKYLDRSTSVPIRSLREGDEVGIIGKVSLIDTSRGVNLVRITVSDATGKIVCTFFRSMWLTQKFAVGDDVLLYGVAERWKSHSPLSMTNPTIEHYTPSSAPVVSIYPQSGKNGVSSVELSRAVKEASVLLPEMVSVYSEVPHPSVPKLRVGDAFHMVHHPMSIPQTYVAKNALAFDELLRIQLVLAQQKRELAEVTGVSQPETGVTQEFLKGLPYPLTGAQERVIGNITQAMEAPHPMHRLLQGDVGSGKAQPLSANVLTPDGYVKMGTLAVGDDVVAVDGTIAPVTGVYPQGLRPVWHLVMADGTTISADGDHLWNVTHLPTGVSSVVTTQNLHTALSDNAWGQYGIPTITPPTSPMYNPLTGTVDTAQQRYTSVEQFTQTVGVRTAVNIDGTTTFTYHHSQHPHSWISTNTSPLQALCEVVLSLGGTYQQGTSPSGDHTTFTLPQHPTTPHHTPPHPTPPQLYRNVSHIIPPSTTHPDMELMQCIHIDHPLHMYITERYTATHNTTVAFSALLTAVSNGHQAALMAPTEILAQQLYDDLTHATHHLHTPQGTPLTVDYFANTLTATQRATATTQLKNGTTHIAVGTHMLLSDDIEFDDLSTVVIDEQHRFGVEQRDALRQKTRHHLTPDTLVMTATPIPRTAAMTAFGDLDVDTLDELPPGRQPIFTQWIDETPRFTPEASRTQPWTTVLDTLNKKQQVFIVCPLVEESDTLDLASVTDTYRTLQDGILSQYRVGLVHGQQKPADRANIMSDFVAHKLDALVATTVIEVGVNIPNATLMIIVEPSRFGISQLHQLRGRVGRGKVASTCILYGRGTTPDSRERLAAIVATTDGFKLSRTDLKLRGHGSLFGTQQSGISDLRIADLRTDEKALLRAHTYAQHLLTQPPTPPINQALEDAHYFLHDNALQWIKKS